MSGDDATSSGGAPDASTATVRLGPRFELSTVSDAPGRSHHDLRDRARDPTLPARIGRFSIESRIGAGGMGVVYKAEDKQLGRKIAIKLLRTSLPDDDDDSGDESVGKLLREAQTLAKLDHPNVVAVHEVGVLDGEVFVAMEFIEGQTLRQWLRSGPRAWEEVREAFVQAGRGLAAAHRAGLVHRDFKPENAMIDGTGRVRVLDFGLARAAGSGPPSSLVARMIHSGTAGPQTTTIAGTPAYMAPEQHLGLPCDARSDQFSFCVSFYEAVFGARPFPDGDAAQRFQAIMAGELRRSPRPVRAPGWLRAALVRGLAAVPNRRFSSMDELLHAVTEAPRIRRRRLVAATIVLLGGIVAGLAASLYVETRDTCTRHADRLDALWSSRRDALQAAIVGSGAPYAAGTWERLDAVMRARAAEWARVYRGTCEAYADVAVEDERPLDLRMQCLHRQAGDVEAVLTALAEEPAAAARHAIKVEDQLDPVAACGEVASLPGWGRADVRATVRGEALHKHLIEVKAAGELGRYKPALARAQALLGEAREFGEPALIAEALLRIGNLHKGLVEYERAEANLEEAYWLALEAGIDTTAAEAAASLLSVTGAYLGDREKARMWERSAAAMQRRVPDNHRIAGTYYNNRAVVRARAGDQDGAERDYQRALAAYRSEGVENNPRVALVLGNMSRVAFTRGDLAAAAEYLEQSLAIRQRALGDDHPEVAITMSNLALVLIDRGDVERATALLRRALVIEERLYGARHAKLAPTLDNLARASARGGRFEEALQLSHRALGLLEGADRPDPSAMSDVRLGLGLTYALQGRFTEALPELRQAVALRERALGADHPDTTQARLELAETLLLAGAAEEAEAIVGAALASYRRGGATDRPIEVAEALRGRILLARGAVEAGRPLLERALVRLADATPLLRGRTRAALARALLAADRARALTLAEQAEAELQAAGAGFERERAALASWRAAQAAG